MVLENLCRDLFLALIVGKQMEEHNSDSASEAIIVAGACSHYDGR